MAVTRRGFLGVVSAGAALTGMAGPAGAFRIQEASEEIKAIRFSACGAAPASAEHDKIRAEIARLLSDPALPAAERDKLNTGMACPLCGGLVGPGC